VIGSTAIQDSELVLGLSDVDGTFLRGGRAAGSAFGNHEIFGLTPGGGPGLAQSFFDVFFDVNIGTVAEFRIWGTFEGHNGAYANFTLEEVSGPPVTIFNSTAAGGAFIYSASANLLPGSYRLFLGAEAYAVPGASGSEYDFMFVMPEPSTWMLALVGLAGAVAARRRLRR